MDTNREKTRMKEKKHDEGEKHMVTLTETTEIAAPFEKLEWWVDHFEEEFVKWSPLHLECELLSGGIQAGDKVRFHEIEFSRGGNHLHAAPGGGGTQGPSVSRRRAFRRCLAYRRGADDSCGAAGDPGAAVFSELCGGRHALCGGGGADPRDVTRKALQHRHGFLCRGLQRHDDAGCGAGIGAEVPLLLRQL